MKISKEELVKQVEDLIISWSSTYDKLIVAIDGYTGIGKTTLLRNLATLNSNIIPVNRDDFILPRKIVEKKLEQAIDWSKVFETEICDNTKFEDFIRAFKTTNAAYTIKTYDNKSGEVNIPKTYDFSKKVLVTEGVFMFHPLLPQNKLWDKRIYLKGNTQEIDKRRIAREKAFWGDEYFPETDPHSYFGQIIIALKRYIEQYFPEQIADAVFEV
jgi:uridine kinase